MALLDAFKNMNIFGARTPSYLEGIVSPQQLEQAKQQSLAQGLLGTAVGYLAQPKNQGYGSAVPYLAKGYLQGMQSAQSPFQNLERDVLMKQKFEDIQQAKADKNMTEKAFSDIIANNPELQGKGLENYNVNQKAQFITEYNKSLISPKGDISKTKTIQDLEKLEEINQKLLVTPNDPYLLQAQKALRISVGLEPAAKIPEVKTQAEQIVENLTDAEKEYDKKLVNELKSFETKEFADIDKNLQQLDLAIKTLEEAEEGDITGTGVGIAYKTGQLDLYDEEAAANQERVAEVAQRNLKLILGAQFAKTEGEQLIARAYNPALSHAENIDRIKRLRESIINAYTQKKAMLDYFKKNRTFAGFSSKSLPSYSGDSATTTSGSSNLVYDPKTKTLKPKGR